jgi:hypothetical protein
LIKSFCKIKNLIYYRWSQKVVAKSKMHTADNIRGPTRARKRESGENILREILEFLIFGKLQLTPFSQTIIYFTILSCIVALFVRFWC